MTNLYVCPHCSGSVPDALFHPACRVKHLEALLIEVKTHLTNAPNEPLPENLAQKILAEELVITEAPWDKRNQLQLFNARDYPVISQRRPTREEIINGVPR